MITFVSIDTSETSFDRDSSTLVGAGRNLIRKETDDGDGIADKADGVHCRDGELRKGYIGAIDRRKVERGTVKELLYFLIAFVCARVPTCYVDSVDSYNMPPKVRPRYWLGCYEASRRS